MTDDLESRIAATLDQLKQWCGEQGIEPAGDGAVPEPVACRILGYSERALAKQYELGCLRVPYRKLGPSRRVYRLSDLARHIELSFVHDPV